MSKDKDLRDINKRFNTNISFVEAIVEDLDINDMKFYDYQFDMAIGDFDIDEDAAMELMMGCETHEFFRVNDGWLVTDKS